MAVNEEMEAETPKKRLVVRIWLSFLWGCLCAILIVAAIQFYRHRNDPNLINYCVACIPVALTILIAFVPDLRRAHMGWRIAIVGLGFAWSFLLWRQIVINSAADIAAQTSIVNDAVGKANKHSDGQFEAANHHADTKFGEVEGDVKQISDQNVALSNALTQATGKITDNLGKVGKPDPPVPAALEFSLWSDTKLPSDQAISEEQVTPDANGKITVHFWVRNTSSVEAQNVEVWTLICTTCTYSVEPKGSEAPPGSSPQERHKVIGNLNPGVAMSDNTLEIKVPPNNSWIGISFAGTCKNCSNAKRTQDFHVWLVAPPQQSPFAMQPQ